jgi:hypothetical protein
MAETTITQSGSGQTHASEPTTIDLETGSTVALEEQTDSTETTQSLEEVTRIRTENEQLRSQLERQRQQNSGAQAEARRLAERIAHLEGRIEATPADTRAAQSVLQTTGGRRPTKAELSAGLRTWLNSSGDDGLEVFEQFFAATNQPQTSQSITEDAVRRIARESVTEVGRERTLRDIVGTRHPELANPQSDFSRAIWDNIDAYEQEPTNQMLYPKSETHTVLMVGPDGTTKPVSAQLVDRLAVEMKARLGIHEGRRQEQRDATVGAVTSRGNGNRQTRTVVEAINLLTPGELNLLRDPKIRKGWGPKLPADDKAAAKYIYDGLSAAEKAKRLENYRQAQNQRQTA